jgi:NAD/NADP transhydrogenase alpha subunit
MIIGILKETGTENRVAILPGEVAVLKKMGIEVLVEHQAGERAFATDKDFQSAGATIVERSEIVSRAEMLLSINPPLGDDIDTFWEGQILCSVLNPVENSDWLEKARLRGLTVMALDLVPRTTRAQSMDILSSSSAVKEEVKSLGGKFIEVEGAKEDAKAGGYAVEQTEEFKKKQQELIQERAIAADVVIATAQIPGKKAPVLLLKETVNSMKPGSVIVDLAASSGGNCELTENGKNILINGVNIIGKSDYPSDMPSDASKMFGCNIINLLKIMVDKEGKLMLNMQDDILNGTTAVHSKEYISQRVRQMLNIK